MAALELLALQAQRMYNARLLTELDHAVRLVVLFGPARVFDLAGTLEALHEIIEAPLVAHIAHNDGASDFFYLARIVEGGQRWIFGQIELH